MNSYDKACIESLQKLIGIKSVKYDGKENYVPTEGRPFGNGIGEALEYVLSLCDSMGMETENCKGYAGYAQVGQGAEMLGILMHLDVVPEGKGWDFPPYGGQISDGRLYGRGAIDDKGPAMAVIYALKELMDEGYDFGKRVRLIFGCDEESDWECMDYYTANEECPDLGFTPDADFPLIYGEMGILGVDFVMELPESESSLIHGGEVSNAVPDFCKASVAAAEYGIDVENVDFMEPVFSPLDSRLANVLMEVYREETGDDSRPLTMGGGTYARAMDNILAYGPVFPGREATEHMKNEYILVDDLIKIKKIYKKAIMRLSQQA